MLFHPYHWNYQLLRQDLQTRVLAAHIAGLEEVEPGCLPDPEPKLGPTFFYDLQPMLAHIRP